MTLWALYFLMIFSAENGLFAEDSLPFWKAKEKVYRRISEQREVIVTANTVANPLTPPKNRLVILGGGHVSLPIQRAFSEALKFDELPKITDYVTKAVYDKSQQFLNLDLAAFGHKASLGVRLKLQESEHKKQIQFVVETGVVKGLVGQVDFFALSPTKTEVGLNGHYNYEKFPIPKVFAEFGLEFIIQRMGLKIRQALEATKNE